MSIIKISAKRNNYITLDKSCVEEARLSWGAKGLHTYLIGKPANWEIRISHLVKQSTNGRDAVYKFINELIETGYIERIENRSGNNQFQGVSYLVTKYLTALIRRFLEIRIRFFRMRGSRIRKNRH